MNIQTRLLSEIGRENTFHIKKMSLIQRNIVKILLDYGLRFGRPWIKCFKKLLLILLAEPRVSHLRFSFDFSLLYFCSFQKLQIILIFQVSA